MFLSVAIHDVPSRDDKRKEEEAVVVVIMRYGDLTDSLKGELNSCRHREQRETRTDSVEI